METGHRRATLRHATLRFAQALLPSAPLPDQGYWIIPPVRFERRLGAFCIGFLLGFAVAALRHPAPTAPPLLGGYPQTVPLCATACGFIAALLQKLAELIAEDYLTRRAGRFACSVMLDVSGSVRLAPDREYVIDWVAFHDAFHDADDDFDDLDDEFL